MFRFSSPGLLIRASFAGAFLAFVLACVSSTASAQKTPPWSKGENDPVANKGVIFSVSDIDNVPDLHGNPAEAQLVLFVGGNQFFVMPELISAFEREHPELKGRIFYETLPPGILRKQIASHGALTLSNLTIQVNADIYEAGAGVLHEMQHSGEVNDVVEYVTNDLEIMIAAGNPKGVQSLKDLRRPDLRLAMPNPQWEGVATQIADSLRKAGGDSLYQAVYQEKVKTGATVLTEIHHRQTPMRIMSGQADAGVTWSSEVRFQESIGNPIQGVAIPATENTTAVYAAGTVANAPHPAVAAQWLAFLKTEPAQAAYRRYGFRSLSAALPEPVK